MKVTDEMLMALADGELDQETALGVARSVDADPALGQRLAEFEVTRALAKQAFGGVLEEPVAARLIAVVEGGAGRGRTRWQLTDMWWPIGAAVAASVAGFAVATVLMGGPGQAPALLPDPQEIAHLLQTTPSGAAQPWPGDQAATATGVFEATGSYAVPEGICRTFSFSASELSATAWRGVACHQGEAWNVEIIVAGSGPDQSGFFSTASDRATQSIDAFLDAMGAGGALDATAEQRLLQSGWRPGDEESRE